jgi:hypothetical protein
MTTLYQLIFLHMGGFESDKCMVVATLTYI